ncbi:MAG: CehA/McbA family metallohydrolase [Myxococcaceae bacterium]|nr:CehA/McbA family metallohydrolase [Myxococcaceae bacterium]
MRHLALLAPLLCLACPQRRPVDEPMPPTRCEVNLDETMLFSKLGTGARAKVIESNDERIGGGFSQGRVGDVLLANDKVRVVIQQAGRVSGPVPYGGAIIDADLVRPAGQAGRDQLGKISPFYAFGRTPGVDRVEVLEDGSKGGYAVVAATGDDALIDGINLPGLLSDALGELTLRSDPNTALPLKVTTYYVLSPGESRVRLLTAFCNSGRTNVVTMVGDFVEGGGAVELFNPTACTGTLGTRDCTADPVEWFGLQAEGVAYGYRAMSLRDRRTPGKNVLIAVGGSGVVMVDGKDLAGLLSWTSSGELTGAFGILPNEPRLVLRDFVVDVDLARVQAQWLTFDGLPRSRLDVTALDGTGQPAPGARIAVVSAESGKQLTLAVADAAGKARFDVPVGNYRVSTGSPFAALENPVDVSAPSTGEAMVTVRQGASRTLRVSVVDPAGRPLTAKVVVRCSGVCPNERELLRPYFDLEPMPSDVQAVEYVPASGQLAVKLPAGTYEVFVSRGPTFSAFPDTFPTRGQSVDLTTADAMVSATLAQVVDTTGWLSADLHVHAIGSTDSSVPDGERVASFAAEGVDVLVSTDHDFLTDYAPIVRDLGLSDRLATVVGCEVSPFDFGHQNAFPAVVRDAFNGGPVDWAGGEGPTLRLDQLYGSLRTAWPDTLVQMNHPRTSRSGTLRQLEVDTARGTSRAKPERFRMEPHPMASATDTRLFSLDFDALELMNEPSIDFAVANDWMTFLSRGWVKTATAVSDTHTRHSNTGGAGRTWVFLGADASVPRFSAAAFTAALKQQRATGSSGPFVTMTARRADGQGPTVSIGQTLSAPASTPLELIVEVQAPEWMQFDALELYTHAPGREAAPGMANGDWPESRILQRRTYPIGSLPLEAVPGLNGFTARRVKLRETFAVTASADTWFVAMVRSSSASRSLAPAVWSGVRCRNGVCTAGDARAQAFTNPIFVDADGSGRYDTFPLQPGQPLVRSSPRPQRTTPVTRAELEALVRSFLRHDHAD